MKFFTGGMIESMKPKILLLPLCLMVLLIAAIVGAWPAAATDPGAGAYKVCQEFVKDALKAPASASFPAFESSFAVLDDAGAWEVTAYVDSQNDFGALLRTDFSCTTIDLRDGNWRKVRMDLNPR